MSSQILRPTTIKRDKGEWLIQGPWGRRNFDPMSKVSLYRQLYLELLANGVLPLDAQDPSNGCHSHVTIAIMTSSWLEGRWVRD